MFRDIFNDGDLRQIEGHGLTLEEVRRQLELFRMGPPYLNLLRPCTPGDGISVIGREKAETLIKTYEADASKRHCCKFVPASGAASRMFKTLLRHVNEEKEITGESVSTGARAGQAEQRELLEFMNGLRKFAFFGDLKSVLSDKGYNIDGLLRKGRFTHIIRFLLTEAGLNYAVLPKGLIKFHQYVDESRTAFEEHLVESASYLAGGDRTCHLHFTVSQEHMNELEALFGRVTPLYEERYDVMFHAAFSIQKGSTDTLAVDMDTMPFRETDGSLLFRPGGHGALMENLNDLKGEIIFIKNIDNVVPDRLKPSTSEWKKILAGHLIAIQKEAFGYVERLMSGVADGGLLDQAMAFSEVVLGQALNGPAGDVSLETKRQFLLERLNRPIRVCGMVKNEGEPGGGPFWVKDTDDEASLQIVEAAQVDPDSEEQRAILASSTHFNPVDLVCGVTDFEGRSFDLRKYVDQKAVFISSKSKDGKELKALEHPGLWNGAMAKWITVFVEVPSITFNPVKTVNDLLRKEHQVLE